MFVRSGSLLRQTRIRPMSGEGAYASSQRLTSEPVYDGIICVHCCAVLQLLHTNGVVVQEMAKRAVDSGLLVRMMISDDDSTMRARTMKGPKCKLDEGFEVHRFGADPSHRTRIVGSHLFALANKKMPGEEKGDSRLNSAICTKFKSYHGCVVCIVCCLCHMI